jgi:hypothetical protein
MNYVPLYHTRLHLQIEWQIVTLQSIVQDAVLQK